jgi:hypothetical protein
MPHWRKRLLFLVIVGGAAGVQGCYLGPLGFDWVAVALLITEVMALG